jgi:hypothetical protein
MTGEGEDRRRCERVPLAQSGNYILESGRYYPCEIENVSATGMLVRGVPRGHFGEWVVTHVTGPTSISMHTASGPSVTAVTLRGKKRGRNVTGSPPQLRPQYVD